MRPRRVRALNRVAFAVKREPGVLSSGRTHFQNDSNPRLSPSRAANVRMLRPLRSSRPTRFAHLASAALVAASVFAMSVLLLVEEDLHRLARGGVDVVHRTGTPTRVQHCPIYDDRQVGVVLVANS